MNIGHRYNQPEEGGPNAAASALHSPSRLDAARASGALDAPPDESFDGMTRLAATLLGTPASFVSISDGDRDFYLSQVGFPDPLAQERELKGPTFCHHALANGSPLAIDDTHADPVWRAIPTVDSLGVRAYLGAPIFFDGEPIGSFCVIDAKARTWTPVEIETIAQLAKSTGREIGLRAALRHAKEEAAHSRAQSRRSEETVAVVAHDLRTPLQVMAISASALSRSDDPASQGHARRMSSAIAAMSRMVDDLLASYALENAQQRRGQPVLASKLLRDAADTMAAVAARAGIAIAVDASTDACVLVDYSQMLRALCNLVGNCVKYCPAGSAATLRVEAEAGCVSISVADDGPGMAPDEQTRAFDRGWQGAQGLARQDGAGLGLSIVRSLVEQNGGAVSLSSQEGSGTKVVICLPVAQSPSPFQTVGD